MPSARRSPLEIWDFISARLWLVFTFGIFLCLLEISFEERWFPFGIEVGWPGDLLIHLGRVFGEFLVIAASLSYLFTRVEQIEFINRILDHQGFITTVSRVGITNFTENPRKLRHEEEISKSKKMIVCLRGSKNLSFFSLRDDLITERLISTKSITVFCLKSNFKFLQDYKDSLFQRKIPIGKLKIGYAQTKDDIDQLMYSFLIVDRGVWIKTYFSKYSNHLLAAPAFFVERGTPLWKIYREDLIAITGTKNV